MWGGWPLTGSVKLSLKDIGGGQAASEPYGVAFVPAQVWDKLARLALACIPGLQAR